MFDLSTWLTMFANKQLLKIYDALSMQQYYFYLNHFDRDDDKRLFKIYHMKIWLCLHRKPNCANNWSFGQSDQIFCQYLGKRSELDSLCKRSCSYSNGFHGLINLSLLCQLHWRKRAKVPSLRTFRCILRMCRIKRLRKSPCLHTRAIFPFSKSMHS